MIGQGAVIFNLLKTSIFYLTSIGALSFILAISGARAAEPFVPSGGPFQLSWRCQRTADGSIPKERQINFTQVGGSKGQWESPELLELLSQAQNVLQASSPAERWDFYPCFERLLNTASHKVRNMCVDTQRGESEFCKEWSHTLDAIRTQVLKYGKATIEKSAVPRVVLGTGLDQVAGLEGPIGSLNSVRYCTIRDDFHLASPAFIQSTAFKKAVATLSESCRQSLVRGYSALLIDTQLTEKQCSDPQYLTTCNERRMGLLKTLDLLALAGVPIKQKGQASFLSETGHCLLSEDSLETELAALIANTVQTLSCVQLKPGENRNFNSFQGTPVLSQYRLERLNDNALGKPNYRVQINFDFVSNPPIGAAEELSKETRPFQERMAEQVQNCFDNAEDKLKGPNGETMRFEVFSNPKRNSMSVNDSNAPTIRKIQVHEGNDFSRENSSEWNQSSDCEVVMHETLHVLGLVDEYVESDGVQVDEEGKIIPIIEPKTGMVGLRMKYDCRIPGPADSIMSNHREAFRSVSGVEGLVNERKSLLFPAQFRSITQPGCLAVNSLFYACSNQSYESSFYPEKEKASGFSIRQCGRALPAACYKGNFKWLQ